jgi:hypothetical protein
MHTADVLLTTYENMLGSLDGWLAKAESHPRGDGLLEERLAPDMFPLAQQIRFVCNLPGESLARLTGMAFASSDRDDSTLAEARSRIAQAREQVGEWRGAQVQADQENVELTLPIGMTFDLDTAAYVRDWALPQFYFHLMTAYAILRMAGVPLGKADYVGYIFRYLRQPRPA